MWYGRTAAPGIAITRYQALIFETTGDGVAHQADALAARNSITFFDNRYLVGIAQFSHREVLAKDSGRVSIRYVALTADRPSVDVVEVAE